MENHRTLIWAHQQAWLRVAPVITSWDAALTHYVCTREHNRDNRDLVSSSLDRSSSNISCGGDGDLSGFAISTFLYKANGAFVHNQPVCNCLMLCRECASSSNPTVVWLQVERQFPKMPTFSARVCSPSQNSASCKASWWTPLKIAWLRWSSNRQGYRWMIIRADGDCITLGLQFGFLQSRTISDGRSRTNSPITPCGYLKRVVTMCTIGSPDWCVVFETSIADLALLPYCFENDFGLADVEIIRADHGSTAEISCAAKRWYADHRSMDRMNLQIRRLKCLPTVT